MKNQKGITLIALIITIIVMLILVGVSVSVALNTGLFKSAQGAAKNTQEVATAETALSNGTINIGETDIAIDKYVASLKTISKTEDIYEKCYADVDGDGNVDGIIYADLAFDINGTWLYPGTAVPYSYAARTGFKDYYISGTYNGKEVLSATGKGNDRFYVMALEDIIKECTWYESVGSSGIAERTSSGFGTGKANTATMLGIWKADKGVPEENNDIWGQIEENSKWFVPSLKEWAAYADLLDVNTENYSSELGLSNDYWTSDQYNGHLAEYVRFDSFYGSSEVSYKATCSARLSTTF